MTDEHPDPAEIDPVAAAIAFGLAGSTAAVNGDTAETDPGAFEARVDELVAQWREQDPGGPE